MELSDLSDRIRSVIKWFLISLVIIFVLWLIWLLVGNVSKLVFKPRGEATAYGKLAPPFFTKTFHPLKVEESKVSLTISLPSSKEETEVYKIDTKKGFTQEQQNKIIAYFAIPNPERTQSGKTMIIENLQAGTRLDLNGTEGKFTYRFNFARDPSFPGSKVILEKNQSIEAAERILKNIGVFPKDLDSKNSVVNYLAFSADKKINSNLGQANGVDILIPRKFGYSSLGQLPVRVLLAGAGDKIIELDYFYSPSLEPASPYPILNSDKAWEGFRKGGSFTQEKKEFTSATVEKMYLAYWESKNFQPYIQPVWVFEGKGTTKGLTEPFQALLPAVSPSFLQK
jgi:hypothetical protein